MHGSIVYTPLRKSSWDYGANVKPTSAGRVLTFPAPGSSHHHIYNGGHILSRPGARLVPRPRELIAVGLSDDCHRAFGKNCSAGNGGIERVLASIHIADIARSFIEDDLVEFQALGVLHCIAKLAGYE